MDVASLKTIHAIAETGSVTAAAESLHCVQSNVTARLKRLEHEVGAQLVERHARGVRLTPAGEILADYARRVMGLMDEARAAVAETTHQGGRLRLGSMETTAAVRLPGVLMTLRRELPKLRLTVSTDRSDLLAREVLAGRLDAALVGGMFDHPDLSATLVLTEQLVDIIAPEAGPEAQHTLLSFRQGCAYRALAENWMRSQGRVPYDILEFGSLDALLGCVSAGMGCALLPRSVIESRHLDLTLRPLPDEIAQVPTMLITRRDARPMPVLERLRGLLSGA